MKKEKEIESDDDGIMKETAALPMTSHQLNAIVNNNLFHNEIHRTNPCILDTPPLAEQLRNQHVVLTSQLHDSFVSNTVLLQALLQRRLLEQQVILLQLGGGAGHQTGGELGLAALPPSSIEHLMHMLVSQASMAQQPHEPPRVALLPQDAHQPPSQSSHTSAIEIRDKKNNVRAFIFPQKLYKILSDLESEEGGKEIACFLPHGKAFAIHKQKEFVNTIIPKYFRMSRYSSFLRQLKVSRVTKILWRDAPC